jgi:hypothetical protein
MKKYLFLLMVGAGALFTACNQDLLEIPQKGVVGMDEFYITDEDAESALVTMYADFAQNIGGFSDNSIHNAYMATFNLCADDMLAAGSNYGDNDFMAALNEFRYDSSSEVLFGMYKRFYWTNHKCNLITDNFEYGVSDVKDRAISEARVIRAWIHMMLAIGWNNPPKVDHVLEGSDKPTNCDHIELLKWCAQECEDAVKYLDKRANKADKNAVVKVTEGFAWAVAGKAWLFAGEYANAKAALKHVIEDPAYDLVPGNRWTENFHKVGDGNEEKIFETNINYNAQLGDWGGQIQRSFWMHSQIWTWRTDKFPYKPTVTGMDGWGGLTIRKDFAEEMLANEGDSPRRKGTFITTDEFINDLVWPSDSKPLTPVYGKGITRLTTAEQLKGLITEKTGKDKEGNDEKYYVDGDGVRVDNAGKVLEQKEDGSWAVKFVNYTSKATDVARGISDPTGLYGMCEYMPIKRMVNAEDVTAWWGTDCNFMIMRYAEVLLMYAEAAAQSTDEGGIGLQALNYIQTRAGAPTTALTLENVKKEKKYEMWLEGVRWPDMVRWGDTDGVKNNGKNIPSLYDKFFTEGADEHEFYVKYSNPNEGKTVGYQDKHAYFPFPYNVVAINPELKQREGF